MRWTVLAAVIMLAAVLIPAGNVSAADGDDLKLSFWASDDDSCFIAAMLFSDDSGVSVSFADGKADDATWSLDGTTLTMTFKTFKDDRFTAAWDDDITMQAMLTYKDQIDGSFHTSTCTFQRN